MPLFLVIAGLSGTIYFGLNLTSPVSLTLTGSNKVAAIPPPPTPKAMGRALPIELKIPAIDLDTTIVDVGRQANGAIAMPNSFVDVGWYTGSPTPGERGPSVIVGHVDRIGGIAIFWRLRELKPGDSIEVIRQDGSTAKFIVTEAAQFPQNNFPSQEVYGNISYAGLRLITCGGTFDTTTRHYSDNTVIYAALE